MTRLVRSLATAALALTAFTAAPALADGRHEHRHDARCGHVPGPVVVSPIPPPPPGAWRDYERHERWERHERKELVREYRRLDRARDRFYASWNGNPRTARRFERWYAHERAELDRKWTVLAMR